MDKNKFESGMPGEITRAIRIMFLTKNLLEIADVMPDDMELEKDILLMASGLLCADTWMQIETLDRYVDVVHKFMEEKGDLTPEFEESFKAFKADIDDIKERI